jgi:hypothetical protein
MSLIFSGIYTIFWCKLWIFMNNHACKVGHPECYSVKASDEEKYNIAKVVRLIPSPLLLAASLKPISQCLLCDDKDPGMLHRSCKLWVMAVGKRPNRMWIKNIGSYWGWKWMQDVDIICRRRGGDDMVDSHSIWLASVPAAPDVIAIRFVSIASLLTGVSGNNFLSDAINLYLQCMSLI